MHGHSENSKEQCEFSLKIKILKLNLKDKEKDRGFEDIALSFTLDSNVTRIENISSLDENVNIVKEVFCQTTPENFVKKLKTSAILINLIRECADLGTVKIQITDCFTDAILDDEFSSEKMICDYTFVKDGNENASMELELHVNRTSVDNEAIKDFLRANAKRNERQKNKGRLVSEQYESSLSSGDGFSSFVCDADLLKELCPPKDNNTNITSASTKSKASKCFSDIATSLDVNKFSEGQKTFCHGCRGYSISGITCDNKNLLSQCLSDESEKVNCKSRKKDTKAKCDQPVYRICSECFADLSILPEDVGCPNCSCASKINKLEERQKNKKKVCTDTSISYFQKMLKDIFVCDTKKQKKKKSVYQVETKVNNKKTEKKRNKAEIKRSKFPRCAKVKRANDSARTDKRKNLRTKHHGVVIGHKHCKCDLMPVPKNMGWLWNANNPGISTIRRGWKPGAVPKSVAKMMRYFLVKECDIPPADGNSIQCMNEKPTLKVEKKLGEYTIILNPLCDDKSHGDAAPIVFKIAKSEDEKRRCNARRILKCRGITKSCECNDISSCSCINDCQKQSILCELEAISEVMCIIPEMKYEELNEASECSEIDFEFTPPFEMMNKCKRDVGVSVAGTQYEEQIYDKFEDVDESSEDEIVVPKLKNKKKKTTKKVQKKIVKKMTVVKSRMPEILREIEPKCPTHCKSNIQYQCEFNDYSTTNFNPFYQRCLPSYQTCPPRSVHFQSWNTCCNSTNNF